MLEHYNDRTNHFSEGQVVEVDKNLADFLLNHRKAVEVTQKEARHLDVEPQFEQAEAPPEPEEVPVMSTPIVEKRAKRGGGKGKS